MKGWGRLAGSPFKRAESLAWGGPVEKGSEHYYRIHGGNFVVEYINRQNGANHTHSVLRDVDNDFGVDVLREHLLEYHVL